jgi:DNA-binding Lrp family transcriptional regulator
MKAIILIKIHPGEVQGVFDFLKRLEAVTEAYMTFGPYDAVASMEAENLNEIGKIVAGQIQPIPGVVSTLTLLAFEASGGQPLAAGGLFRKKQFPTN